MNRRTRRHKTTQFSIRLTEPVFEGLERRAREFAESRNALAERYIAEGLKMEAHPGIWFRAGALGRRAALAGTRLDVWQVVRTIRDHDNSLDAASAYLGLPVSRVRAALGYYAAHREEVDDIADRETATAERAEAAWRATEGLLAREGVARRALLEGDRRAASGRRS